jgi:hypothetical protein
MRVGLIRQDLSRIYLDDVENTSQRNFSSQPPGQSRYFEYPSNLSMTSTLNEWAFLSNPGTVTVIPVISGANNTLTAVVTSGGPTITMTIPPGTYTVAQLAVAVNATLANAGLAQSLVAFAQGATSPHPGALEIDTVAPGALPPSFASVYAGVPQPPIGSVSPTPPAPFVSPLNSGPTAYMQLGGTFQAALGLSASALSGVSVNFVESIGLGSPSGLYVNTGIAGQSGTAASITAGPSAGVYTVSGLTGMTVNSTLHRLFITGSGSGNNGTYQIVKYVSPTSVLIATPPGQALTVPDANNPAVHWNEDAVTYNISIAQIGTLSTFANMVGYSLTTPSGAFLNLLNALQNVIAPGLIETGPVLLSFANGKLSILSATYFQPGYPPQSNTASPFGFDESAVQRLGYAQGPAVFITENDGMTPYTL